MTSKTVLKNGVGREVGVTSQSHILNSAKYYLDLEVK